jgi:23S rRNA (adenine2503-C2)-methyltransferase
MTLPELKALMQTVSEPQYRADQIFSWLHAKGAVNFSQMTNIPAKLRDKLNNKAQINSCVISQKQQSKTDGTVKYLFAANSTDYIESVVMRHSYGNSICVSSQVGCAMGCVFCASAQGGFVRNLTAGEMLSQLYEAEKDLNIKISNVVIMGTGEPMLNYAAVLRFTALLTAKEGKNISERSITLSTCGIVPKILDLAKRGVKLNLAVSLHSANDSKRAQIMPGASAYSVRELADSAEFYFSKTGRRVTWEYMLLNGINDYGEDALLLAKLLKGKNTHVNIINYNKTNSNLFSASRNTQEFIALLTQNGINATLRKSMGSDIDGACGQLRAKKAQY